MMEKRRRRNQEEAAEESDDVVAMESSPLPSSPTGKQFVEELSRTVDVMPTFDADGRFVDVFFAETSGGTYPDRRYMSANGMVRLTCGPLAEQAYAAGKSAQGQCVVPGPGKRSLEQQGAPEPTWDLEDVRVRHAYSKWTFDTPDGQVYVDGRLVSRTGRLMRNGFWYDESTGVIHRWDNVDLNYAIPVPHRALDFIEPMALLFDEETHALLVYDTGRQEVVTTSGFCILPICSAVAFRSDRWQDGAAQFHSWWTHKFELVDFRKQPERLEALAEPVARKYQAERSK